MGLPARYHKIPSSEGFDFIDEQDEARPWSSSILGSAVNLRPFSNYILHAAFLVSVLLNAFGVAFFLQTRYPRPCSDRSLYAGLERNITQPWTLHGLYDSQNENLTNQAWEEISIDTGTVALEDSFVEAKGLPKAQRFPWDKSKGIYLINGYHSLHCLKQIRHSYIQYRIGAPQSGHFGHISHCFETLYQDILCNADDTPRYSGFQPRLSTGLMQEHQCRNWSQLEQWAKANTACWRYLDRSRPGYRIIEEYGFCPEDSPYAAKVAEVFGSEVEV